MGTSKNIALHSYPTSEEYRLCIPKLLTTYAAKNWGWERSSPFCYFGKSIKVIQLPKSYDALPQMQI